MGKMISVFFVIGFMFAGVAHANDLPDTGITKCYDSDGNEISCPSEGTDYNGQDASYQRDREYMDNGDGTIRDLVTELVWQQADDGTKRSWEEACDYCEALELAGYSDWREPTLKELATIVDYARTLPAIDTLFKSEANHYWSGNTSTANTGSAWHIDFYFGNDSISNKSDLYYTRCVRGGVLDSSVIFTDNNDGTVSEVYTGLTWQQTDDGNERTWKDAMSYCESCTDAGYSDWRLPDINELRSIVDYGTYNPSIDSVFACKPNNYWTGSTSAGDNGNAWRIDFNNGADNNNSTKSDTHYVRCVRGGSSVPFAASTSFSISAPQNPQAGDPITFTALVSTVDSDPLYYRFGYKPNYDTEDYETSSWVKLQDWSTSNACTHSFDDAGSYIVTIDIADTATFSEVSTLMGGVITIGSQPETQITGFSMSVSDNPTVGETVSFSANATAEDGDVYYLFGYKPNYGTDDYETSTWVKLQDWSTSHTCTTSFPEAGTYVITVDTSDQVGYPVSGKHQLVGGSITVESETVYKYQNHVLFSADL